MPKSLGNESLQQPNNSPGRPKRPVISIENDAVFTCAREAADAMGLSSASSIGSAARKRGGKAAGYHWFFADEAPQSADDLPALPRNTARTATCIETGETFPSLKSAAQSVGLKGGTSIRIAAETGTAAGGLHWTVAGIASPPQLTGSRARTARCVICVETGEVFPNLQTAAESAGLKAASSINRAINQQRPAAGKHWRWADEGKGK